MLWLCGLLCKPPLLRFTCCSGASTFPAGLGAGLTFPGDAVGWTMLSAFTRKADDKLVNSAFTV